MKKKIIVIFFLTLSCNRNIDNSIQENTIIEYSPESKLTHEYSYIIQEGDTIKHGKAITKNERGQIMAESDFNYGKHEGLYTAFYEDGSVRFKEEYRNGRAVGNVIY